jgi:hypothetical protein
VSAIDAELAVHRRQRGHLVAQPWTTWRTPQLAHARVTAAERRPLIAATATPLPCSSLMPWPSRT